MATTLTFDPLFEILESRRLLDARELAAALQQAELDGTGIDRVLLARERFSRRALMEMLENHYFCPSIDIAAWKYDPSGLALLPRGAAERQSALPLQSDGEIIKVAFLEPDDRRAKEAVAVATGLKVVPLVALPTDLREALAQAYDRFEQEGGYAAHEASAPRLKQPAPTKRVHKTPSVASQSPRLDLPAGDPVQLVDAMLTEAAALDATDLHVQPSETALEIRLRIDGILHTTSRLPHELTAPVVSRLKILSNLDIAEHRLPQDGRFSRTHEDAVLDLRVSILPSQFGEKVVIRLLRKDLKLLDLENLDMPLAVSQPYQELLDSSLGFYLVTGPTGSGKTTTLYATLGALDRESLNVATLEDPVEYTLAGITQVQIREDIGLSFGSGLRSILRQDPDVILVGEIRDLETVEIASRAALTGHKVFSTLHTNDACQAVTRLLDMGTPAYLIAATLKGVLAQRLVRRICEACKESYAPNETEIAILGDPNVERLHRGHGCEACAGTGYRGRSAIYEYFHIDETIHRLILDRASPYALRHAAKRNGMIFMAEFARRAVIKGDTTVEEIQRVILSDETRDQLCSSCQRVIHIDFAVCPFCQHVLKEKCEGCGSAVDPNWEACPSCGDPLSRDWQKIYCRSCMAPVETGWESCHYCGENLS